MKPTAAITATSNASRPRLFTFASGGWVVLLAGVLTLGLIAWAIAPALLRNFNRPPGDGKTIESYAFDLSNLAVPREQIRPAMLHRDMVPVMTHPTASGPDPAIPAADDPARWKPMQRRNDLQYGKYLVPSDLVIGVAIGAEARAYPLSVMYVHEVINDTLAGVPIAVTYHWPCASAMVFDRRAGGRTVTLGVSGLVYSSNLLMYDMTERATAGAEAAAGEEAAAPGGEDLWSQLLAQAISGEAAAAGATLAVLPAELVTWRDWSGRHPSTTVLDRDLSLTKRYADAAPTQYLQSEEPLFPVQPAPPRDGPAAKAHVLAVRAPNSARRIYPVEAVLELGQPAGAARGGDDDPELIWRDTLGGAPLRFIGHRKAATLRVELDQPQGIITERDGDAALIAIPAYWFAWHAMHPDDPVLEMPAGPEP